MALPTSGPLSINDIRVELGASSTNQSLEAFSNTAGFSAPDAVSDFYGFSSYTQFYITTGVYKLFDFCDITTPTVKWHNGLNALPTVGDTIYSNSTGTTVYTWIRRHGISTSSTSTAFQGMEMSLTSGVIGSMYLCL
jgi:hypothetical protein